MPARRPEQLTHHRGTLLAGTQCGTKCDIESIYTTECIAHTVHAVAYLVTDLFTAVANSGTIPDTNSVAHLTHAVAHPSPYRFW